MTKRLFIAIPLPDYEKDTLNSIQDDFPNADVRWTAKENLHITVYFCGDVEEDRIPAMDESLKNTLSRLNSFKINWKSLLFAPHGRPPRMIWAEYEGNKEFTNLVHSVFHAVKDFFRAEKPHNRPIPHITVARFKHLGAAKEIDLQQPKIEPLAVTKIQLISSELTPEGPIYKILYEYEIA